MATKNQTFGEWIRAYRESQDWSIQSCAQRANVNWNEWKRFEEDEPRRQDGSPPMRTRKTVLKIAQGLKLSPISALRAAGYTDYPDPNEASQPFPVLVREDFLDYDEEWLGYMGRQYARVPPGRYREEWKSKLRQDAEIETEFLTRLAQGDKGEQ